MLLLYKVSSTIKDKRMIILMFRYSLLLISNKMEKKMFYVVLCIFLGSYLFGDYISRRVKIMGKNFLLFLFIILNIKF